MACKPIFAFHAIYHFAFLYRTLVFTHNLKKNQKTKPWHPLYNIILFSLFGWLYMNGLTEPSLTEALITGAIWAGICIVFDVFGWVLIKHPWSLSFKEFYVDYQPWITLIYIAIFAGPLVGYWFALI